MFEFNRRNSRNSKMEMRRQLPKFDEETFIIYDKPVDVDGPPCKSDKNTNSKKVTLLNKMLEHKI